MTPALIVSPSCVACAFEIPNWAGGAGWVICTRAEMAWAAIGMMAPARSRAPCRTGRQNAARTTTTASAIITSTSPVVTRPGLDPEKASPSVSDCD